MKEFGIMPSYFLDHVYYWGDYHYESVLGPRRVSHQPSGQYLGTLGFPLHCIRIRQ